MIEGFRNLLLVSHHSLRKYSTLVIAEVKQYFSSIQSTLLLAHWVKKSVEWSETIM